MVLKWENGKMKPQSKITPEDFRGHGDKKLCYVRTGGKHSIEKTMMSVYDIQTALLDYRFMATIVIGVNSFYLLIKNEIDLFELVSRRPLKKAKKILKKSLNSINKEVS